MKLELCPAHKVNATDTSSSNFLSKNVLYSPETLTATKIDTFYQKI